VHYNFEKHNKSWSTIPGKLQTYMAAGKPIVGVIDGDASKIIRNASCGYCVNSGDSVG